MKLHVENEGVCNIAGFAELEALVTAYRHPRLGTSRSPMRLGRPPAVCSTDLARLLPFTDILHFKDYDNATRRFVAVGEGDIPNRILLGQTLPAHDAPLTLTIETHAPSEPALTTRRSVHGLRRMVDSLPLARSQPSSEEAQGSAFPPGGAPHTHLSAATPRPLRLVYRREAARAPPLPSH